MVARDHRQADGSEGRVLEEFAVGNSMALGENTVPILWEHIRRFMEEKGPAIRQGETLQVFERPTNLWQSMGVVSPFGPRFFWWWRQSRFIVSFYLLVFPFSFPFFTVWAICNWISHMTIRKTLWPEEVHQRIGEPVQQ